MKDNTISIPVGAPILGRVLNASGEPIDKKGPISSATSRLPLNKMASAGEAQSSLNQMFETGIKVIDLLAPISRGGISGLFAGIGLGKLVVMEELMHNMIAYHSGYIVCLGMDASSYEASELKDPLREAEFEDKMVMIFEQMTDSPEIGQRIMQTGLTIAAHFRDPGHEVMLVADRNVATRGNPTNIDALRNILREKAITTIILAGEPDKSLQAAESSLLSDLDARILFSAELPKQNLWPAIDRLSSSSRLLDNGLLSAEHAQVARQVKQILQRYAQLQKATDVQGLSAEDSQVVKRAQRIQWFLTQPFFVAEAYTDIPGEYVKVEDTIQGFKELLEGLYDDVPVEAFWFVGTVDQALARAQKNV